MMKRMNLEGKGMNIEVERRVFFRKNELWMELGEEDSTKFRGSLG